MYVPCRIQHSQKWSYLAYGVKRVYFGAYLENGSKMGYFGGMAWQGVKIGLIWGYSGHVQKQASKCGKNRQVLAGFSEMAILGVILGPNLGSF